MHNTLLNQVRRLRIYNLFLTAVLIAVLFFSFKSHYEVKRFEEINVERINIIEKDGRLKMVISNQERHPEPITNGIKMKGRGKAPGIILYNSVGDECGGFLFAGDSTEAGQILTFDQYKQDQIMSLQYNETVRNGKAQRLYGLAISNRPDTVTSDKTYLRRKQLEEIKDEKRRQAALTQFDTSGVYGSNR